MNITSLPALLVNLQSFTIRCKDFLNIFFISIILTFKYPKYFGILFVMMYLISCGFIWFRKGDYYKYLAKFKSSDDRKDVADLYLKAYEVFCYYVICGFLAAALIQLTILIVFCIISHGLISI